MTAAAHARPRKGSFAALVRVALDIVWVALWVIAAVIALATLGYVVGQVMVHAGWLSQQSFADMVARVTSNPASVNNGELPAAVVVSVALGAGVAIAGSLIIVSRLRGLFKNLASGKAFSAENARHIRVIWITLMVLELSRWAIAAFVAAILAIFGQPQSAEIHVNVQINLMTWGCIAILIAVGEVFREGARMKAEQELTI